MSGRDGDRVNAVVSEIVEDGGTATPVVLDATRPEEVCEAAARVEEWTGGLETLVHCAGTNVKERWWDDLSTEALDRIVHTNLSSVAYGILAVLPGMRTRRDGRVVVVSSWAAWQYLSLAGSAYSASKAGLGPLVASVNDQEGRNGIRATLVCPGEVATPLMLDRPEPPSDEDLARMLQPEDLAAAADYVVSQPPRVCVNELVVSPAWNRFYERSGAHVGGAPD
ncbi:SDR family NAD(P)-dependent oxidoreductase [Brooklawnia cerclae]